MLRWPGERGAHTDLARLPYRKEHRMTDEPLQDTPPHDPGAFAAEQSERANDPDGKTNAERQAESREAQAKIEQERIAANVAAAESDKS